MHICEVGRGWGETNTCVVAKPLVYYYKNMYSMLTKSITYVKLSALKFIEIAE